MNDRVSLKEALISLIEGCLEDPESAKKLIDFFKKEEPFPNTQRPAKTKDPTKTALKWLWKKQWIKRELINEPPPVPINGGIWEPRRVYEIRITKSAAHVYRGLMEAVENRAISLEKDTIADFMMNHLKTQDGGGITHDSLTHADKNRQKQTK
jgi:hypothetical protein